MLTLSQFGHRAWHWFRPLPPPTIVHVTHWKAGSQWIHRILHYCASERVVTPEISGQHFLGKPVQSGKVYPTVYATKEEFDRVRLPRNTRRFLVIRDLRDTLVSWYFSLKISHVVDSPEVLEIREALAARNQEEGLLWAIQDWSHFAKVAAIQKSWLKAGEPFIRYEDILENDEALLEQVLLNQCGLDVSRDLLRAAVRDTRFERLTGGRPRGMEDVTAHERKGIAGDWRNYFTDRIRWAFKSRFGELLIASGYQGDNDW